MVTLTPPQKMTLSNNPIRITLTSNDYVTIPGGPASAMLQALAVIPAGVVIPLKWSAGDIAFTFVLAPDNSGTQLPSGDGSPAHIATVITWMQYNFYLDRDYLITQDTAIGGAPNSTIIITAKVSGTVYNLVSPTVSPFNTTIAPGINRTLKPNFKHFLQVWRKGFPDTLIYDNNLQLDNTITGATSKNLQKTLDRAVDYDIPDLVTIWQPCVNSFMEYYLRYGQTFGDTPTNQRAYKSSTYFTYLGGYSMLALGAITIPDQFQKSLMPNPLLFRLQKWFETYPIDRFSLKTNTPQFLYFINNRDIPETFALKIDLTFDTVAPQTVYVAGGSLNPYNKVCINCSYKALGLNTYTNSAKKVTGYAITLVEATAHDPRSLTKYFTIDRSYQEYYRMLLYSDSAGNFKTLQLLGESQLTGEVSDELAERFVDETTPKRGSKKRYNIKNIVTDTINTGYITDQGLFDSIQEFMLSEVAFRVYGNQLVPIIATSKKFDYAADGKNQNASKLEYQLAFDETYYTASGGALIVPLLNQPQLPNNDI